MELRNGIICSCCLISPQKAVCIVALKFSKEQFQPSCSGGETLCITFLRKRKLGIIYLLSTPVIAAPYFYLLIRQRRFNRNFYMNERKMQLCNGIRNRRNVYVNIMLRRGILPSFYLSKTRKSCFFLQNRLLLIYCSSVYEQFFQLHCCVF